MRSKIAANNSKVVLMPLDASSLMGRRRDRELIKEGAGDRKIMIGMIPHTPICSG